MADVATADARLSNDGLAAGDGTTSEMAPLVA